MSMSAVAAEVVPQNVFIARQPIFRRDLQVHGYELLFRGSPENRFDGTASDVATSDVIANTFLTIGTDKLLNGKLAFINFGENMFTLRIPDLLPHQSTVVEILESVRPTAAVISACQDLKRQGYTLALDDVGEHSNVEPWLPVVGILKVDFVKTGMKARRTMAERCRRLKIKLLAEKLESREDFDSAVSLGYDYFQGFFFARPEMVSGRTVPQSKLHLLRLLREVSAEEADLDRVEKLVAQDVTLTFKLLRYLNSAAFGWRGPIKSVRHAISLLGLDELRKWICLLLLASMSNAKLPHVVIDSLVRARFAELLAPQMGLARRKSSAFLLGLLSQINIILNCPLELALSELSLEPDVSNALLGTAGTDGAMRHLHVLTTSYEAADWVRCTALASEHHLPIYDLSTTYVNAVNWADAVAAL